MAETLQRPLRVFLCHAKGDKPDVRLLYERLLENEVDVWLDEKKLMPGQKWQQEIPKAVKNSDIVIICLSKNSVNKEGYIQKEIKFALDIADEKTEGSIFIIPARLDDCIVPDRFSIYQWVDLFDDNGYEKLLRALILRAEQIKVVLPSKKVNYQEIELQKMRDEWQRTQDDFNQKQSKWLRSIDAIDSVLKSLYLRDPQVEEIVHEIYGELREMAESDTESDTLRSKSDRKNDYTKNSDDKLDSLTETLLNLLNRRKPKD